jgi:hypothetical protein
MIDDAASNHECIGDLANVQQKLKRLSQELDKAIDNTDGHAQHTYGLALGLLTLAVGSSVLAAIIGILTPNPDPKFVGLLALVPGFVTLIGANFKLSAKTKWYYHKSYVLAGLRRRLNFEGPIDSDVSGLAKHVSIISADWKKANEELEAIWERDLATDLTSFGSRSESR